MRWKVIAALVVIATLSGWSVWQGGQDQRFVARHAVVTSRPLSVFEWRNFSSLQTPSYEAALSAWHRSGYRTVYVAFDAHAAAASADAYGRQLNTFGELLQAHDMHLALVAGDPTWAQPTHYADAAAVLRFVQSYNTAFAAPVHAVLFDVEPYIAGADAAQTADMLTSLTTFINARQAPKNVPLGWTAPFWLNNSPGAAQQFVHTVGQRPGNFVVVMDYRVTTSGTDGNVAHASAFLALTHGSGVQVLLALDASPNGLAKTTFAHQTQRSLRLAQYRLDRAESAHAEYAGQAVNDAAALAALSK